MNTIPFSRAPRKSTVTIGDESWPIEFLFGTNDEATGGWINGRVEIAPGVELDVGGGWVDTDGGITPYNRGEIGDIDDLIEAIDGDPEDDEAVDNVMNALSAALPATWPHSGNIVAENKREYRTEQVIRVGDDWFLRHANGGTRGAISTGGNHIPETLSPTESIDVNEARRVMLDWGLDPDEVEQLTAEW